MSLLHPSEDDAAFAAGHAQDGLMMRVRWVKQLRAALLPFANGTETEADRAVARHVLENTKEWL